VADDADRLPGGDEATHELDHVVVAGKLESWWDFTIPGTMSNASYSSTVASATVW
jgi:hypothetical protein